MINKRNNLPSKVFFQFPFYIVLLLLICYSSQGYTQSTRAELKMLSSPPETLKSGSLLDLFAELRKNNIMFELESNKKIVPVVFQSSIIHNGKQIGNSRREPMPYFPGEMMVCPETFDFVPVLYKAANENGILPTGEYEVSLSVLNNQEGTMAKVTWYFMVPDK